MALRSKQYPPARAKIKPREPSLNCKKARRVSQHATELFPLDQLSEMNRNPAAERGVSTVPSQSHPAPDCNLAQLIQGGIRQRRVCGLGSVIFGLVRALEDFPMITYQEFNRNFQCIRDESGVMPLLVGDQTVEDAGMSA